MTTDRKPRPAVVGSGALALGAIAFGAFAVGAIAIGRLAIGRASIRRLNIDELVVRQLRITGDLIERTVYGHAASPRLPGTSGYERGRVAGHSRRDWRPTMTSEFIATWQPRALALLRIVTAYLFIQHGTAKLLHIPHDPMFDGLPLLSLFGIAGVLEIVGGALVLLGWFTRPAAFILSGEMAVAYFMEHVRLGHLLSPMLNQGEPAVLFCFIFLCLSVAGPGTWCIDNTTAQ